MSTYPKEFECPITMSMMCDPVIDPDGYTYERTAIVSWISEHGTSPFTRNPITTDQLAPNRVLKDAILAHGGTTESPSVSLNDTSFTMYVDDSNPAETAIKIIPNGVQRPPVDICIVIDVSGSMSCGTSMVNETTGEKENSQLTVLDIVKHGVKAVIAALDKNDRVSIVKYSDSGEVIFPLERVTTASKARMFKILDDQGTEGCTNLWDGLHTGLQELRGHYSNHLSHVLLFTDGQPNREPPRGHIPMLKMYRDKYPDFPFTVNTYGFGYSLDSDLLDDIAHECNGMYAFIPDAGFVGTIFVNSIASICSTGASQATLSLEGVITDVVGYKSDKTSWGAHVDIGDLSSDQSKTIVVNSPGMIPTLKYKTTGGKTVVLTEYETYEGTIDKLRARLYTLIRRGISGNLIPSDIAELSTTMSYYMLPELNAMVKDLNGQVKEGVQYPAFKKWGKHFLLSLSRAHLRQQCLNFKDPGVQHYGGTKFTEIRDLADDAFNALPVPQPTSAQPSLSRPTTMMTYNSQYGGCFDGDGVVKLKYGSKLVSNLKKGDELANGSKIVCVVQTQLNVAMETCCIDGVYITPWHPVKIGDTWKFPAYITRERYYIGGSDSDDTRIYNLVLDSEHIVQINDLQCITLGHGMEGDVVGHKFFGTQAVINDLKRFEGYDEGDVLLFETSTKRGTDGLVSSFDPTEPPPLAL